jgi:monovalent cation/hydrogen antiporter
VEREVRLARVETLRAALAAAAQLPADDLSGLLRRRYEVMLRRAEAELDSPGKPGGAGGDGEGALAVEAGRLGTTTAAQRQRLVALRADGTIGDAAFQRLEQELDLEELDLQQLAPAPG